jgi:hypothetical protein
VTEVKIAIVLFAIVFVLNMLPAFAPPTWTTMSFIGLVIPNNDFIVLSLVAATAATVGRIVLAKLSRELVRRRLLSEGARRNVDNIRVGIESRPTLTFGTFLAYALSPLPSNYLFIAYGLTSLPIAFLSIPFFVGRASPSQSSISQFWLRSGDPDRAPPSAHVPALSGRMAIQKRAHDLPVSKTRKYCLGRN